MALNCRRKNVSFSLPAVVFLALSTRILYHYFMTADNKVVYDQSVKIFNILNSDSCWQPYYYIGRIPNFHLWQYQIANLINYSAVTGISIKTYFSLDLKTNGRFHANQAFDNSFRQQPLGMPHFLISLWRFT